MSLHVLQIPPTVLGEAPDITVALRKALAGLTDGDTLFIPQGVYVVRRLPADPPKLEFLIPIPEEIQYVTIRGAGLDRTVIRCDSSEYPTYVFTAKSVQGLTIKDLSIAGKTALSLSSSRAEELDARDTSTATGLLLRGNVARSRSAVSGSSGS